MADNLIEQAIILAGFGKIDFTLKLRPITKLRTLPVQDIFDAISGRNKFHNVSKNFVMPELFGSSDAVVAIFNVVLVSDLAKFHRG